MSSTMDSTIKMTVTGTVIGYDKDGTPAGMNVYPIPMPFVSQSAANTAQEAIAGVKKSFEKLGLITADDLTADLSADRKRTEALSREIRGRTSNDGGSIEPTKPSTTKKRGRPRKQKGD